MPARPLTSAGLKTHFVRIPAEADPLTFKVMICTVRFSSLAARFCEHAQSPLTAPYPLFDSRCRARVYEAHGEVLDVLQQRSTTNDSLALGLVTNSNWNLLIAASLVVQLARGCSIESGSVERICRVLSLWLADIVYAFREESCVYPAPIYLPMLQS